MNENVRMWLGIIGTAVVVYLIVAPGSRAGEILQSIGAFQTGAIEALQGRSTGQGVALSGGQAPGPWGR